MSKAKLSKTKKIIIVAVCVLVFLVLWFMFVGYQWSWGPFVKLHDYKVSSLEGNSQQYSLDYVETQDGSILKDKNIIFLGSSVTYGSASKGVTFADYIGKRNGCNVIKEAVSGTTLVDEGINSYISRLRKLDCSNAQLLVCQLSTNDATQKKELGEVSDSMNIEDFDTHTVAGAVEYIIAFSKEKWNCPVIFYTNPKYDSDNYGKMVDLLNDIQKKWDIGVIDLWNNAEFNNITEQQRTLYMADEIHPTQAGYLEWWTPSMEKYIINFMEHSNESN